MREKSEQKNVWELRIYLGRDVVCQSYGTTPLPATWDHLASTSAG
jgi:hypothetical protein